MKDTLTPNRKMFQMGEASERTRIFASCASQVEREMKVYGTDKHGLNLEQIERIIYQSSKKGV